jgi:hypothetical protein
MLELITLIAVLTGLGIYVVKSADLPKNLKERSTFLEAEARNNQELTNKKFNFPNNKSQIKIVVDQKIAKKQKQNEIDALTLKITALEQEIKVNNDRNAEIYQEISLLFKKLEILNLKVELT